MPSLKAVRGAVSGGLRRRAEYSSDAGNYRLLPTVVVEPLDVDDVLATLAVSRATGVPVTSRGAGTSVAGNAIGTGIVIDFARHLNRVLEVDGSSQTALVEPGVVMSNLQKKVAPLNLRFGPDPSTQNRATLGGMIGNNACGPHALAYGRTADNVAALMLVDGVGRQINTTDGVQQIPGLEPLVQSRLEVIRTEFGTFPRQVSGYSLEHLLPENGRDLAKAMVGTEGTLGVITEATVKLVRISPARMLVVLGYPDMPAAADAVPALLAPFTARHRGSRCPTGGRGPARQGREAGARPPPRRRVVDDRGRRGNPRRGRRPRPRRWSGTRAPSTRWCSRPARSRPRCGRSGPTVPGSRAAPRTAGRPGPGGRTPPCRRRTSARTCAISMR